VLIETAFGGSQEELDNVLIETALEGERENMRTRVVEISSYWFRACPIVSIKGYTREWSRSKDK
jgi:hypothetical protein